MGLPQQASNISSSSSCFVPSSSSSSSSSCCPASAGSALSQRLLGAFAGAAHSSSAPGGVFPSCPSLGLDFSSYASPSDCEGSHNPHTNAVNRPKRRRKPQKPGKTAKLNDRHFVVHNYHDHANDPPTPAAAAVSDSSCCSGSASTSGQHALLDDHSHTGYHSEEHPSQDAQAAARRRGGVAVAFPLKLHAVLEQVEIDGYASVVSWSPHGRCFVIHKPKQFVEEVMPKYFRQSKLTSFQRQLNLYGFARLTRGPDAGGYYHELFLRRREHLCARMIRTKVKGTKFKAASSPDSEPDFYALPPVDLSSTSASSTATSAAAHDASAITPPHSDVESLSSDAEDHHRRLPLDQRPTNHFPPAYQPSYAANAPVPLLYSAAPVTVSSTSTASYAATAAAATPLAYYGNFLFNSNPVNNNINNSNNHYNNNNNTSSDQILDDAVDELFLHELGATGDHDDDQLTDDFVSDWMCDPTSTGMNGDDDDDDDAQLGFMLERLLED